jgi:hypothetical protein
MVLVSTHLVVIHALATGGRPSKHGPGGGQPARGANCLGGPGGHSWETLHCCRGEGAGGQHDLCSCYFATTPSSNSLAFICTLKSMLCAKETQRITAQQAKGPLSGSSRFVAGARRPAGRPTAPRAQQDGSDSASTSPAPMQSSSAYEGDRQFGGWTESRL